MNVILTGGTGFIGNHLLKALIDNNHNVLLLAEEDTEIKNCGFQLAYVNLLDLENQKQKIIDFNPEAVIHLAWAGIPDYSEDVSKKNLDMSINFLDFIIEETKCEKILVAGSCFEYGTIEGVCSETDYVNYNSFISWAKISLYEYLKLKTLKHNFNLLWFRIFYVYGPSQREASLLPFLISSLAKDEVPNIRTPHNKNDFIYIDDVVNGFISGLNYEAPSGIYNLSSGATTSVLQICKYVESLFSCEETVLSVLENIPQDKIVNFWGNNSKAREYLHWTPQVSMKEGLKRTITDYLEK
jgi:UDP-glucose 4-epimerase